MKDSTVEGPLPKRENPQKPGQADKEQSDINSPIHVIVDFVFRDGLFFLVVENITDQPAYCVSVQWKPAFRGLGGTQAASDLPLFKNIEFLAPHKTIETFLDTSQEYFQRGEPTRLQAVIRHQDARGRAFRHTIRHDLEIYRDLVYRTSSG